MTKMLPIFNINIQSFSLNELLMSLNEGFIVTPNVDHLIKLQNNKDFYKAYQNANFIVCDSKIVKIALFFLGQKLKEVIPGSSFFPAFYNYHKENKNIKIFLLGAAPNVADKAKGNINKKIGRNIIVGSLSPSFGFEKNEEECDEIIRLINQTDATVLVVGVGAPKQEIWISKYKSSLPNIKLFMALGATIDFEAGNIKRAPKFFQKIGMEWLYRLLKEPKRLWKRYLIDDIPFFYYVFLQKIGKYKNPFE
jgi:exopolysaccharide biosynthesis WecB/TagA/CpsF family protein